MRASLTSSTMSTSLSRSYSARRVSRLYLADERAMQTFLFAAGLAVTRLLPYLDLTESLSHVAPEPADLGCHLYRRCKCST